MRKVNLVNKTIIGSKFIRENIQKNSVIGDTMRFISN